MAYGILVIWTLLCYAIIYGNSRIPKAKKAKLYYSFFFFGCALLMGLRNRTVGVDTIRYEYIFNSIKNASIGELFDYSFYNRRIGYMLMMKAVSILGGNYNSFQMIVSIVINYCAYKFISTKCNNVFLSTAVYLGCGFYLSAFNVAREAFAVALICRAWDSINENRRIKALLLSLIAISCHTTAVVFVCAYFVYLLRDNKVFLRILPFIIFIAVLNYRTVIDFSSRIFVSYANYYKNKKTLTEAGGVIIIWTLVLLLSAYVVFNSKRFNNIQRIYGIFCIISISTEIISMSFNYFDRVGTYFILFECLLFNDVANSIASKQIKRLFSFGASFSYLAYFLLSCTSAQYKYSIFF